MVELIKYNPFRVLGVYANSPKKMIMANKSRINAYLKVGKTIEFPEDFNAILEAFTRNSELITKAESQLALPEEALKYSLFWFVKSTPVDSVAFNHLIAGNIDLTENFWKKQNNVSSLQNFLVLSLIQENYGQALSIAQNLYKNYSPELLKLFEIETLSYDSLSIFKLFVDSLIDNNIDLAKYVDSSIDSKYSQIVFDRQSKPLIDKIESAISESQYNRKNGPEQSLESGKKLKRVVRPLLLSLRKITTKDSAQYKILADKASQEILQCAIDYYNHTDDRLAAKNGLPLMYFAKSLAMSQLVKERCDTNINTLEKAVSALPPVEIINQYDRIVSILNAFHQKLQAYEDEAEKKKEYLREGEILVVSVEHPSILALQVLKDIRTDLVDIKSILGKDQPFCLNLSTSIASLILKATIVDVNSIWDGSVYQRLNDSYRAALAQLETVFGNSYRDLLYIEMMDLHEDFRQGTLKQNKDTLIDIIDSFHGFKDVRNPDNYFLGNSVFSGLSGTIEKYTLINKLFFMTDEECYKACKDINDFIFYRDSFPNGKFIEDAEEKIISLELDRKMKAILDRARKKKEEEDKKKREEEDKKRKEKIAQEENRKKYIKSLILSAADCKELLSIRTQYGDVVYECGYESKFYTLCLDNDNVAFYLREFPNGKFRFSAKEYLLKKQKKVTSAGGKTVKVEDSDNTGTQILLYLFIAIIVFLVIAVIFQNQTSDVSNSKSSMFDNLETPISSTQQTDSKTEQLPSNNTQALSDAEREYNTWKDYRLPNGEEPYAKWYGYNDFCDSYGCSAIVVNAPSSSDVVVIIKDYYGDVVRHAYIQSNKSYRFEFADGVYQPFFYFGNGWNPYKEMPNGLKGGFVSDSSVSKDSPREYSNEIMTYTLKLQRNGNFSAQHSNINEAF